MGFLAKLGSTAKLFSGTKAQKVGSTQTLRDTGGTRKGTSDADFAKGFLDINEAIEKGRRELLSEMEQRAGSRKSSLSDLDRFLLGEPLTCVSSNVDTILYVADDQRLEIGYHGGGKGLTWYGYQPVSVRLASTMFKASSKGKAVWDHLRVRGTVFGFQVPYFLMDGPSTRLPKYTATQKWQEEHGSIPPSGETPASWKAGQGPYPAWYG